MPRWLTKLSSEAGASRCTTAPKTVGSYRITAWLHRSTHTFVLSTAEAVFLGHMQHVKCIIVNLHVRFGAVSNRTTRAHSPASRAVCRPCVQAAGAGQTAGSGCFAAAAERLVLSLQNPHLVAVVWSLYASQNQDVADECRRKGACMLQELPGPGSHKARACVSLAGALVATNRKHLLQLVSQSHPKHHAAAAAAAAASAGAASSVESKCGAKDNGTAGSAADGGDSKALQTAETIFWVRLRIFLRLA